MTLPADNHGGHSCSTDRPCSPRGCLAALPLHTTWRPTRAKTTDHFEEIEPGMNTNRHEYKWSSFNDKRGTQVGFLRSQLGGRKAEAPFWADRAGGVKPGCARTGAGRAGRPRSRGSLRCTGVPDGSFRYWAGGVAAAGMAGEVWARLNRLIMSEVMSTELSLNRTWLFWLDEFRIR